MKLYLRATHNYMKTQISLGQKRCNKLSTYNIRWLYYGKGYTALKTIQRFHWILWDYSSFWTMGLTPWRCGEYIYLMYDMYCIIQLRVRNVACYKHLVWIHTSIWHQDVKKIQHTVQAEISFQKWKREGRNASSPFLSWLETANAKLCSDLRTKCLFIGKRKYMLFAASTKTPTYFQCCLTPEHLCPLVSQVGPLQMLIH